MYLLEHDCITCGGFCSCPALHDGDGCTGCDGCNTALFSGEDEDWGDYYSNDDDDDDWGT